MQTGILAGSRRSRRCSTAARSSPARPLDADQIQPASLDLRLGAQGLSRARELPARAGHTRRRQARPAEAARDRPRPTARCWRPAASTSCRCSKAWSCRPTISASANPKSSTGRLDIFTRVMTDHGQEFDKIPAGYTGPLYLEVSPRTFPIVVRTGSRLSQIRFRDGNALLSRSRAAWRCTTPRRWSPPSTPNISGGGIALSIDLAGDERRPGRLSRQAPHRPSSTSTSAPPTTCSISGSRSTTAARGELDPRSRRVLHPRVARGGARAARSTPPR